MGSKKKTSKKNRTESSLNAAAWSEAGWFFLGVGALAVITFFGPTLNEQRLELFRAEGIPGLSQSDFQKLRANAELSQLAQLDATAKDNFSTVKGKYVELAEKLSKKFGDADQRTVLVRLNLAANYIEHGNEVASRKIWQKELPKVAEPTPDTPAEMGRNIYRLAFAYDELSDTETARYLYIKLLDFGHRAEAFPSLKIGNTLSNISQALAAHNEILGRWEEAKQNYLDALRIGMPFRVVGANIYRNIKIASLYNQLGQYKEALPYAQTGYSMALKRYGADANETEDATLELGRALYGTGDYKNAKLYLSKLIPAEQYGVRSYDTCMPDAAIANYYLALCAKKTGEAKSAVKMDIAIARLRTSISLLDQELLKYSRREHVLNNAHVRSWMRQHITVMKSLLQTHFNPVKSKNVNRRTKTR